MSTPRTDAATSRHNSSHWLCCDEVVSAEFARGLEAELAAAKADSARLDWLEQNLESHIIDKDYGPDGGRWFITLPYEGNVTSKNDTLRAAIDAARKQQ